MARKTVLVVEERELALLLRRILRTSGYRVLVCKTGGQALRICSRFSLRIDLVLTTLQLPDIDGGALVAISFIQKPFNYAELIARIREVLGE